MSLRSRVLPALYNGVSQQPPILRSPDQQEDEENTWASLAYGVEKRPPVELLARIAPTVSEDAFVHHINRDVNERYIVIIDAGQVKVYDHQTGAAKVVTAPSGWGYLAGGSFRAVTVADYTFILNTKKVGGLLPAGADQQYDPDHYQWLNRMGAYDLNSYNPNPANGSFGGEVASLEKLPETAPNGTMYKITGSTESGFVSYYVRRNGAVWDETVANGLQNALDATTMPHCLIRQPDGSFIFAPFSWARRAVGDTGSNPPPTFIGRTINDVFFYQNRLGLLVDENVIFSCAGDFGNFWRNTILDYVATDVIDVAVTTNNVALLNHAVAFNDGIMAFADQVQFSITNGEDGLSPESIAISPVTYYEVNAKVRPVLIGTEVYFCGDNNGSSIVWEYTRMSDGESLTAAEITAHVPRYIPSGVTKMIAAQNLKALFALTGTNEVYAYQFYWSGNEKLQSAWRRWRFADPVIGGEYIDGNLYVLFRRPDGVYLGKVHLEPNAKPAEQNQQVYLDMRCALAGVYDNVIDRTIFYVPYSPHQPPFRLIRDKTHPTRPGSLVDPTTYIWIDENTMSVPGNEGPCTGGSNYQMRFQFSRQFPQDYQGRPLTTGRLQLRTFTIYYTNTGFFRTEVSPYGAAADPSVEEVVPAKLADFTGKVVGSHDLILNRPAFHTGSYSFQVYGDAAQATVSLTNDTHVGSTFVSAEWEGFYFNRAS